MSQSNDASPIEIKISKLGAKNYDKKVLIKGLVSSFTFVCFIMEKACFICRRCASSNIIDQDLEDEKLIEAEICSKCRNRRKGKGQQGFELDKEHSIINDFQELYIQERQEDISIGRTPEIVKIKVRGDLTDKVKAGDNVEIVGTLKSESEKPNNNINFTPYIEAEIIEKKPNILEDFKLTEDDIDKIKTWGQHPLIHKIITNSIAPHIQERETIKESLSYSLFGGVRDKSKDKRGDIHSLYLGDPATARSELLTFGAEVSPIGIYTSGTGSTSVGLTASMVQNKKGLWKIEAGALVRADLGILCIDEVDKMAKSDLHSVHTAMEQQILPISKAGKYYSFNTRTTIIASGNFKYGYFDEYKDIADNIDLDTALLTRFDLIFLIQDKPSSDNDDHIIKSILGIETEKDENLPILTKSELKKYIAYAKGINPILNENAKNILDDYCQDLRRRFGNDEKGATAFTLRHVAGLVRLTEAHARMALKEIADETDAVAAIDIMNKSLEICGWKTPENIFAEKTLKYQKQKEEFVLKYIKEQEIQPVSINQIIDELKNKNVSPETTQKIIDSLRIGGQLIEEKIGFYSAVEN